MNQSSSTGQSGPIPSKRAFHWAVIIYALLFLVCVFLIKHNPSQTWWHIVLALIPMIPLAFAVRAFLRFFQRLDELQKRIQLEALALSFGITWLVTMSYGLLEYAGFPALGWMWVPPIMMVLWDISVHIASRRYQ